MTQRFQMCVHYMYSIWRPYNILKVSAKNIPDSVMLEPEQTPWKKVFIFRANTREPLFTSTYRIHYFLTSNYVADKLGAFYVLGWGVYNYNEISATPSDNWKVDSPTLNWHHSDMLHRDTEPIVSTRTISQRSGDFYVIGTNSSILMLKDYMSEQC